jgi:hypothetical protein
MRKCAACGYLLLGDGDTCRHCGAALSRVPAGVAPTVAVDSGPPPSRYAGPAARFAPPPAGAPAVPPPGSAAPGATLPGATPPEAMPPSPGYWQPPVVTAPPKKSRLGALALVVVVALFASAGYGLLRSRSALPDGTKDFVGGRGVVYVAADGSYTAQFPQAPLEDQQQLAVGNLTATVSFALVSTDDYEMGTASFAMPVVVPDAQAGQVLEGALNGGVSSVSGDLVSKEHVTRAGLPAIDAKFKAPDGYSAHVMVVLDGSRMYMLFVHAKTGTDRLFRALDESFLPNVAV